MACSSQRWFARVLGWLIYISSPSIVVGRTLCISFSTAISLIAASLLAPIAGRSYGLGVEADIAVAGVRFNPVVKLDIYLKLTEKAHILLRI